MTRNEIDAFTSRSINTKILKEALELIKIMALDVYQAPFEKGQVKKRVYELDILNQLLANSRW